MRGLLRRWRAFYGENPMHLLAMIGCFALVGYVVSFVDESPSVLALAIWFGGAVIAHDLVLYPLYALADQTLTVSRWARRRALPRRPPRVPAINHVRVPVLGSAVLGLVYFPTISQRGEDALRFTAGVGTAAVYDNWLLITAVLFLGSAVLYAARLGASVARGRRPAPAATPQSPAEPEPELEPEPQPEPEPEPQPADREPDPDTSDAGAADGKGGAEPDAVRPA